ncbi:MAG: hypothetical protein LUF35_00385 [Lachnospiraceae bacterium]|nr:hypothetical protein [Lachnospiraceae bacterium]
MSQEKVDRYKEEKKNRAKIIKKEKRQWMLTKLAMGLVGVLVVVWVGFSVYNYTGTSDDTTTVDLPTYTVDTTALDDYLNTLEAED